MNDHRRAAPAVGPDSPTTQAQAIPRLVIAGTGSGVGKTTATVALARALQARGHRVATFKCGPDYLDPTYHARASGRACVNLDGWMMGRSAVLRAFHRGTAGADIALIEGVMGLFDGASNTSDEGSAAEIARWLDAPVLLVVDAGGMARTVAALALGFAQFDPRVAIGGLLANRLGSRNHLQILREANSVVPILGGLPKDPEHQFPERHLGLRTADPDAIPEALLDAWGAIAQGWVDLDALLAVARTAPPLPEAPPEGSSRIASASGRVRIGVARDEAFHFYYPENLALLVESGAELVDFSPIRDASFPEVDGLLLGGGYPELAAESLAGNTSMRASIRRFAAAGGPIYAECGGLMYLSEAIQTLDGARHAMVGLISGVVAVADRLQALGYVEVTTTGPTVLGPAGLRFRGHQFRYSDFIEVPATTHRRYDVQRRRGGAVFPEGYATGNVLASYLHAHWASNPALAAGFVRTCNEWRAGQLPA